MLVYLFLAGLGAVYFLFFYKSRSRRLLEAFPLPTEDHHPILGIIPLFLRLKRNEFIPHLSSWGDKYGSVVRLDSPFGTALFMSRAEHVEKILTSSVNITKGYDYDYVRPWLGDSLLMSTGDKWAKKRKMLTPAFHFRILEDFLHVFNRESKKMVDILRKDSGSSASSKPLDIFQYVTKCALDIICETAMGTSVGAQEADSEYISAIYEISRVIQERSFRPWLRFEPLWRLSSMYKTHQDLLRILHGFTAKVIQQKKAEFVKAQKEKDATPQKEDEESVYFQTKKSRRLAFLDLLLQVQAEQGETALSDQDIREETDTFMFEGHDTTATGVSFTLHSISAYPAVQEKVMEELNSIFRDNKDRPITSEDLTKMKYLESVIKESLRLFPSVPFIQRKMEEDVPLADGRIIPKGATVGIFILKIHRDPQVFKDPLKFDPERNSSKTIDPYQYIPFSAGPRNCIGQKFAMMEEKVMIANLLRNFKLEAVTKPEEVTLLGEMILRSEGGLHVRLSPR